MRLPRSYNKKIKSKLVSQYIDPIALVMITPFLIRPSMYDLVFNKNVRTKTPQLIYVYLVSAALVSLSL